MYKGFQGATDFPVEVKTPDYSYAGFTVPEVRATAAKGTDGVVHVALVNLDPHRVADVSVALHGGGLRTLEGRILTGPAINSVNSFDHPDVVKPVAFHGAKLMGDALKASLPPKSVVVLDLH
jgi:alpha-N-arabinofuranosidase